MNAIIAATPLNAAPLTSDEDYQRSTFRFVETLGNELAKGALNLPSFPDAVLRIRDVLSDPHATTTRVAEVVQSEPVFTGKLFRMANSVILQRGYGAVTDLKTVINRIGFKTVKNLAMALATRQIMDAKQHTAIKPKLQEVWQHSVDTAAIAYLLARDCGCVSADDALLAGLLHDIGVYYIYSRMSAHPELFENSEAMAAIVTDWHSGIGQAILEAWEFSPCIVDAVVDHETYDRFHVGHVDLTDVVMVGNLLANSHLPKHQLVDLERVPALERLGCTSAVLLDKFQRFAPDIAAIKATLS